MLLARRKVVEARAKVIAKKKAKAKKKVIAKKRAKVKERTRKVAREAVSKDSNAAKRCPVWRRNRPLVKASFRPAKTVMQFAVSASHKRRRSADFPTPYLWFPIRK